MLTKTIAILSNNCGSPTGNYNLAEISKAHSSIENAVDEVQTQNDSGIGPGKSGLACRNQQRHSAFRRV